MPVVDVLFQGWQLSTSASLTLGCKFGVGMGCFLLHFVLFQPNRVTPPPQQSASQIAMGCELAGKIQEFYKNSTFIESSCPVNPEPSR